MGFNSGCVRLEDAARLATWLPGKPLKAQSIAPEQQVVMPAGDPVFLTCRTAAPLKRVAWHFTRTSTAAPLLLNRFASRTGKR